MCMERIQPFDDPIPPDDEEEEVNLIALISMKVSAACSVYPRK